MRSSREQIFCTSNIKSRNAHLSQASSFFIRFKSRSTSSLQSIKASELVEVRKLQIREVFNNIRSRNRIASNSISTSDLRNRSFYHIKHRSSLVCLLQRYRSFCHTKCSSSLISSQESKSSNFRFLQLLHLFLESSSISQTFVTFVAYVVILSNRTMICIDICEQFISIKSLVVIRRVLENAIISIAMSKMFDSATEKSTLFLLLTMYY